MCFPQEPVGFTLAVATCSPAFRACQLLSMERPYTRHENLTDTWSHRNGCSRRTCPRQSCKIGLGLQDNEHVSLWGDDMHCKLTALPVLQCTPLAWPVQDATGGAGVVVGTGVVDGGLVCTLHTMPDHNLAATCSKRCRMSGCGPEILVCAPTTSPHCVGQLVSILMLPHCTDAIRHGILDVQSQFHHLVTAAESCGTTDTSLGPSSGGQAAGFSSHRHRPRLLHCMRFNGESGAPSSHSSRARYRSWWCS